MRKAAADALGKLGEHAASAVPELAKCLAHKDDGVRHAAADALGKLGEHAASAVPELTKCLADEDADVRAVFTLGPAEI